MCLCLLKPFYFFNPMETNNDYGHILTVMCSTTSKYLTLRNLQEILEEMFFSVLPTQ